MYMLLASLLLFSGLQDASNSEVQAAYDYLFSPQEQEAFNALEDPWDRDRFYELFWEKRDPSPITDYNELREEFGVRVLLAEDQFDTFAGFGNGWKTDQGRVFIIYGPPRDIYRSPYGPTIDEKYEVWVYREPNEIGEDVHVEVIFVDDNDDGTFDLLTELDVPRAVQQNALPKVIRQPALMARENR